jgi:hypothetical protein
LDTVENTPDRLVLRDGGRVNPVVAWGITIVGVVGTIGTTIGMIAAHTGGPGIYALLIASILLLAAGLYSLSIVCETTCTFDKSRNRFVWRRRHVFRGVDEKQNRITSIQSIEVTQKKTGGGKDGKSKAACHWFIATKAGVRFQEPGPGSPTVYEADAKAKRIRDFLGKSLVPAAQDTVGNERGIGDRTIFGVLAQLTDPSQRNKEP